MSRVFFVCVSFLVFFLLSCESKSNTTKDTDTLLGDEDSLIADEDGLITDEEEPEGEDIDQKSDKDTVVKDDHVTVDDGPVVTDDNEVVTDDATVEPDDTVVVTDTDELITDETLTDDIAADGDELLSDDDVIVYVDPCQPANPCVDLNRGVCTDVNLDGVAECACNADYTLDGDDTCINQKEVSCDTSHNPENSTNTVADVTIHYTTLGGWEPAADCVWECMEDYALEGGLCINSKQVQCDSDNANPVNSSDTIADVTITYTTLDGWTLPAACAWTCDTDFTFDGGACINQKDVPCDTSHNPENSTNTVADVTIHYTTLGGWEPAADCVWNCDTDYTPEGGLCINSKQVQCDSDNANPVNSSDTIADVTITYTTLDGWTLPAACAWTCDTDFTFDGGACINQKDVPCDASHNPENSTNTVADVTIHYTTLGGWEPAADCVWNCDPGYVSDGEVCDIQTVTDLDALVGDMVKLTWTDPADAAEFDHIEITWTPNGPADPVEIEMGTQEAVFDLEWNVEYTFTVTAVMPDDSMSDGLIVTATPTYGATRGDMYAITGAGGGTPTILYKVDPATAEMTYIGDTGIDTGVSLAINPDDGKAYFISNSTYALYRLDLTTAAAKYIGPVGDEVSQNPDAAFSADGILYAWSEYDDFLITIDLATGAGTKVGDSHYSTWATGLAFDGFGTLIMKAGNEWTTVDPATGRATYVDNISDVPDINGNSELNNPFDFGPDGAAYSVMRDNDNQTGYLFSIDPDTLVATEIGDMGVARISAVAFVPQYNQWFSGIKRNVPQAELTGWEVCHTETYADSGTALADILADCNKASLMIACRPVGSAKLTLAAWAPRGDVTFDTGDDNQDITHNANGLEWYFNSNLSWGFAPAGATVSKNECDYDPSNPTPTNPELRMCWHATNGNDTLSSGYRCGDNDLNGNNQWERVILQADHCPVDYTVDGGLCINQKEVSCDTDNGNPAHSSDTPADVTIHYTTLGGWEAPAACAWTCDGGYHWNGTVAECLETFDIGWCNLQFPTDVTQLQGSTADVYARVYIAGVTDQTTAVDAMPQIVGQIASGPVGSDAATWTMWGALAPNPDNASAVDIGDNDEYMIDDGLIWQEPGNYDFIVRFSGDSGATWTYCNANRESTLGYNGTDGAHPYDPAKNGHMTVLDPCLPDYIWEAGTCINQKDVDCAAIPDKPAHSHEVIVPVTIHYNDTDGWEAPAVCADWECDGGFELEGGVCVQKWFGIQQNLPQADLVGWDVCYTDTYSDGGTPLATILSACNKAKLMLACRPVGSPNFTLAAWAPRNDVTFDTGNDQTTTHNANGLDWYYNGDLSWGFLPAGATAMKNSCDGGDVSDGNWSNTPDPLRLCWHVGGAAISSGWRCGTENGNAGMSGGSENWERVILQID